MRSFLFGVALGAAALFAGRPAAACTLAVDNCGLKNVSPAAGTSVPANVPGFILEGGYGTAVNASHVVDAQLVSGNTIIPLTITEDASSSPARATLVISKLGAQPAPGDYTLEAHVSRTGCNLPGGDAGVPDAGPEDPAIFDLTQAVTLTAPVSLPTTVGTVAQGSLPATYAPQQGLEAFSYSATLSPEMSAFASVARFSFELDGNVSFTSTTGALPTYVLTLWCGAADEGIGGMCGTPNTIQTTAGAHTLRMLAELPDSATPIASEPLTVNIACGLTPQSPGPLVATQPEGSTPSSSASGCNAGAGNASAFGGLAALLGLALVLVRRAKR